MDLAGPIVAALAPGGALVLAGLLTTQARRVAAAYVNRGCRLVTVHTMGEWPTLVLRKTFTGARRETGRRWPASSSGAG
ncbi:MAG: 50S ribosomal protein L11 methyltransferase [Janthinobacterium lividum]